MKVIEGKRKAEIRYLDEIADALGELSTDL